MGKRAPAIDQYILKAQPFAQPILMHIRELVHHACPDVEEKMKWSMPFFDYKGEMLCHMAAFKKHAVMGFWKASLMKDPILMENAKSESAMGHLGKITSLDSLPSDKKIIKWIKEAMRLNDAGIKIAPAPKKTQTIKIPGYFTQALKENDRMRAVWKSATPGFRKEYINWLLEAKTTATRDRRLQDAITWISEGKGRNWKYLQKK